MIELRWKKKYIPSQKEAYPGTYGGPMIDCLKPIRILEYRILKWYVDAGGAVNVSGNPEWSDWMEVPDVEGE